LNEATIDLVPAGVVLELKSQFSPEKDADSAADASWALSSVSSLLIFVLSTPGSRAATSFALISETTSIEALMAE